MDTLKVVKILTIAVFVFGALVRIYDIERPVNTPSWRENDEAAIARNFVREGMNPLYPRVDWRGDGPGYAEMEFPFHPYLMAASYEVFGIHDSIGRVWSCIFSLATMIAFLGLARHLLSPVAALAAFAFLTFNPLAVELSTAIQPESIMLLAYVLAVYFFVNWYGSDSKWHFALSLIFTALAILSKASSAHIEFLFALLFIGKYGGTFYRRAEPWAFGALSVLPGVCWYIHAKSLWLNYGNSLGLSNQYHWIGRDFLTDPTFILGIVRMDLLYVWLGLGAVAGIFAVWRGYGDKGVRLSLPWLASAFAFYLAAARTTSADWAYYYHIFSVMPAALLIGVSIHQVREYLVETVSLIESRRVAVNLLRAAVCVIAGTSALGAFLLEAKGVRADVQNEMVSKQLAYDLTQAIKTRLNAPGPLVASGGRCIDDHGYQVAYNASYMFYWLDRKGWNICVEDLSLERVMDYQSKGAAYFVSEKRYTHQRPGLDETFRRNLPVVAENEIFTVFQLNPAFPRK